MTDKELDEAIRITRDACDSGLMTEINIAKVILEAARAYASLPKMQKVDLDGMITDKHNYTYNRAIDDIKAKYGELYTEVK